MSVDGSPLSDRQVRAVFGELRWRLGEGGAAFILDDWAARNLVTVHVPVLEGVQSYTRLFDGRVVVHRKVAQQVFVAFSEVERRGFGGDLLFWGGSFVPRLMRGSTRLSHHSWGIAWDLNQQQNPFHKPAAVVGEAGYLGRVAGVMSVFGIIWGGRWRRPDGMHFEVKTVRL